jgi:hypothetical protein
MSLYGLPVFFIAENHALYYHTRKEKTSPGCRPARCSLSAVGTLWRSDSTISAKPAQEVGHSRLVRALKIRILEHGSKKVTLLRVVDKNILKPPLALDLLFSDNLDFLLKLDSNPHRLLEITTCENACATSDA